MQSLVEAWIKASLASGIRDKEERAVAIEPYFWAIERLFELVDDEPEKAWSVIQEIRAATHDHQVLANLAAGHFEDLFNIHGAQFIDRIEVLAGEDVEFRHFLGGVWPDRDLPDELVNRLKAIAMTPRWD